MHTNGAGFALSSGWKSKWKFQLRTFPLLSQRNDGLFDNDDFCRADTSVEQLKNKIQQRQARVGIIGMGYVGLPLALLYSEQKFQVTGFDIDQRKVDALAKGASYIYRITTDEIQAAKAQGFTATSDYAQITKMDAVIICVPTPLNEYHEPDLSFITDTTHSIAPHLRAGQLVILESTTYPGTTEEVMVPILEKENKAGLKAARYRSY